MKMRRTDGNVMTVDPNKQAFPLISATAANPPLPDNNPASPTKEVESLASSSKASIELPRLINSREEVVPVRGRDQDHALKPSLPAVRKSRYARNGPRPDPDRDEVAERFQIKTPLPYQTSNFRSSVIMRAVPIQKKKDASRQSKSFSSPLNKKRVVAVHTEPFLWANAQEGDGPMPDQTLPEKFLAEKERLTNIRGQKRRMMQPVHRQLYSDLHVGGRTPEMSSKLDYKEETDKIRHAVLPTEAQEIYLGRGITLPDSHSTVIRKLKWQERIKTEAALPSSAPTIHNITVTTHESKPSKRTSVTAPPGAKHRVEHRSEDDPHHIPPIVHRSPVKLRASRAPAQQYDSGVSTYDGSIARGPRAERRPSEDKGHRTQTRKTSGDNKKTEKAKKCGNVKPKSGSDKESSVEEERTRMTEGKEEGGKEGEGEENKMEEEDNKMELEMDDQAGMQASDCPEDTVGETEIVENLGDPDNDVSLPRPDSEMDIDEPLEDGSLLRPITRQSVTPKPPSPNPLMSADLHLNITAEKRDELAIRFTKLDADKDGHITFKELETTFPQNLSRSQQRYIKEAYDLVSASTFFGLEEFVTISCLCERLAKLTGPMRDAFEKLNLSKLQQEITHFVVLFSTLDRQQTGCISLDSFRELLATALEKDIASSTSLFNSVIDGMGKSGSLSVDKVEYLVGIPYFLTFK
ncbi:uncharacterized protein [Diadema antillarum]|uniref:uncharacterized protein n=1 Tax=Diadema antillarum TaxID=105358 RepID=UPI003A899AFD